MNAVKSGMLALLIGLFFAVGCGDGEKSQKKPEKDREMGEGKAPSQVEVAPSRQKIVVSDLKICEGIRSRTPIKVGTRFPKTVRGLYCFSEIRGAEKPTTISHLWYYKGRMMADVTLSVNYQRMRTWSSKNIQSDWIGEWKVYVVSSNGNVLASTQFVIE